MKAQIKLHHDNKFKATSNAHADPGHRGTCARHIWQEPAAYFEQPALKVTKLFIYISCLNLNSLPVWNARHTWQEIEIGMVKHTEWRTRAGRQAQQNWLDTNVQGVLEKVESRGICLVNTLLNGLKERVYNKEEVTYIENCRRVLDIQVLDWCLDI